jgi:hypothetical protein
MRLRSRINLGRILAPALTIVALSASILTARADTFNLSPITIDTQSLSGNNGYLMFSYGPDTTGTTPVNSTVSISSSSFATFNLNNTRASNYEVEPFTFGNSFTFTPTFTSTSTPGADSGNLFTVYALDGGYNPYPTADPTGGNAAVVIFQSPNGSVSTPTVYKPVPEASTFAGFGVLAFCTAFALLLRRRRTA